MTSKLLSVLAFATFAIVVSISSSSLASNNPSGNPSGLSSDLSYGPESVTSENPMDNECAAGTLSEMEECTNATLAIANRDLETVYSSIRSKLQGDTERRLVQAQKVWSAYREGQCEFQGSQMSGSAQAQSVTAGTCRLQETRDRIRTLKAVGL